jgi:hypothetical protein
MKLYSITGLTCLALAICSCSKSAPPTPSQVQTQPSVGLQDPSKATSEGERQQILDENTRKYNNWHLEPTQKVDY